MFQPTQIMCCSRLKRFRFTALLAATAALFSPESSAQGNVTTLGGTGLAGYVDGVRGSSEFSSPQGLAVRGDQLFIADSGNHVVRTLRLGTTQAGTFARGNRPVALVFDSSTNLFVANQGDSTIEQFDFFGNSVAVYQIPAVAGELTALAIDRNDNIYIAQRRGVVLRLDPERRVAGQFGTVSPDRDFRGVAVFDDGKLLVSDAANHVIWRVADSGLFTSVYAGAIGQRGSNDGDGRFGRLNAPQQIAAGPNGTLVVADRGNHQVRVVSCTGVLSTLYGIHSSLWFDFPGPEVFPGWWDSSAAYAEVRDPVGVAVSAGVVYGTENYYHLVRAGTGLAFPICPTTGGGGTSTNLVAPVPHINPGSGYFPNGTTVTITASNLVSFPRDTRIYYTLDGSAPTSSSAQATIGDDGVARIVLSGPVDLGGLRVRTFLGDLQSAVVAAQPTRVPVPILSPSSGYYPMGVDVSVRAAENFPAGTLLYYTTDGSDPTTNSLTISHNGTVGMLAWREPQRDLRSLRVRAFLGPNVGQVVAGQSVAFPGEPQMQGEIGVPPGRAGLNAGIGSFYILPIVANLRDQQALRSVQFVVELTAGPGAPHLERTDLQVLPMSTNDFIQVLPAATTLPDNIIATARDGVNRLAIAYFGTNSGFNVQGFATVAMLGIQFRAFDSVGNRAEAGEEYTLRLTQISGTSDGVQRLLPLKAMSARTIRLQNISFLEGDTSPAYWYNAGDFGNGMLENGDVNNAVFAAFGFRRPYDGTDAFAAIDVYRVGILENVLEYNDAATILRRSLGFEAANLGRTRNAEGSWTQFTTGLGALSVRSSLAAQGTANLAAVAWERDVLIRGGTMQEAEADRMASIPVYMKARTGRTVSGMQFVADVVPANGAPAVSGVRFVPAGNVASPAMNGSAVPGLGTLPATVYARWDNLEPGFTGEVLLGHIQFSVPRDAATGQGYAIVFHHAGGATIDQQTGYLRGYLFETMRGYVWVNTTVPDGREASDEWKAHFFGDTLSPLAAASADADGDGFTNWQEYLAGTNPKGADWSSRVSHGQFTFRWVGEAGRRYVVESTADLSSWNAVTGQLIGQDALLEYHEPAASSRARFYRLKVQ